MKRTRQQEIDGLVSRGYALDSAIKCVDIETERIAEAVMAGIVETDYSIGRSLGLTHEHLLSAATVCPQDPVGACLVSTFAALSGLTATQIIRLVGLWYGQRHSA